MILWLDNTGSPPSYRNYLWARSVDEAKRLIISNEKMVKSAKATLNRHRRNNNYRLALNCEAALHGTALETIDIGDNFKCGAMDKEGYAHLLLWMEKTRRSYRVKLHAKNPDDRNELRRIVNKNGWHCVSKGGQYVL